MKKFIAEIKLYYSLKGNSKTYPFTIKISEVYLDKEKLDGSPCFACEVVLNGLDETGEIKYGMDAIQAINLASNIEPLLKRLSKRYNLFWSDKSNYF